jgi:hypothetical protein
VLKYALLLFPPMFAGGLTASWVRLRYAMSGRHHRDAKYCNLRALIAFARITCASALLWWWVLLVAGALVGT